MKKHPGVNLLNYPPRKRQLILGAVLLVFLLMWLVSAVTTGIAVQGKILCFGGGVKMVRTEWQDWKKVQNKLIIDWGIHNIKEGDIISTTGAQRTVILFKDAISLRLAPETSIEFRRVRKRTDSLTRVIEYFKGKTPVLLPLEIEIFLTRGRLWVDKSEFAHMRIKTNEALIYPGRSSMEVLLTADGTTKVGNYRGNVYVALSKYPGFKARVFPGQRYIIKNRKFTSIAMVEFRKSDSWQNWNFALSYITPPDGVTRYNSHEAPAATVAVNSSGGEKNTHSKGQGKQVAVNDRYSFERWVKEKTRGGHDPYPKYSPALSEMKQYSYLLFPQAPGAKGASGKQGEDGEESAPPPPPSLGPGGISSLLASESYSGSSFTPVWGKADGGSASSSASTPVSKGSSHSGGSDKSSVKQWFPFVDKDDSGPPPPPSLETME
ncbi:MAG: hypothetical protein RDV48_28705 [Candidatus Eremiobacteraeota bacterium]|nr:hypothetical protein [Candidatus Eremiobacteraeota bacterium]